MEREVGLAVTNSMQLIWVQTDVGSERYHVLFKFTIKQKKKGLLTVVRTLTWQAIRHMADRNLDSWQVTWHVW
jgi:hypothetical protein